MGSSHEGTGSCIGSAIESRIGSTIVREGSTDLSNNAGAICTSRDVASIRLTIDGQRPHKSMSRNVSCCEQWEVARCYLHGWIRAQRVLSNK